MFVVLQNQDVLKRPWSKDEDDIVIELVHQYGPKNWTQIAAQVPGRTGKQCRERLFDPFCLLICELVRVLLTFFIDPAA